MGVREVLLLLSLLCAAAFGASWTRLDPHIVPNGTVIEKNGTHLSFHSPDGKSSHFLRSHLPQRPWNAANPAATRSAEGESDTQYEPAGEIPAQSTTASGWVSSFWSWGNSYTFFSGQWSVPHAPTNNNGRNIVFFFNSFEGQTPGGGSGSDILQPVLQFNNGVGGWTLASWYGDPNGYVESTPVGVSPGDTITGVITLENDFWYVNGYVNGALRTQLSIRRTDFNGGIIQNTAQWALEVYNMEFCDMYPPSNALSLSNIYLKDNGNYVANPSWGAPGSPNANACNAAGTGTSSSSVTITWQSGISGDIGTPVVAGLVNVDQVGNDISNNVQNTALLCASACDNNAQCNAWTWDSGSAHTCWLKSAAGARTSSNGKVSGVKVGRVGFDMVGADLPGQPLPLPAGSTASTCAAYCQGNGGCTAWAFDTSGSRSCWLKAGQNSWSGNGQRTSGVKGGIYVDHSGGDLSNTVLSSTADATQCQLLCSQTSGCTSWAFALPTPGCDNFQRCWLKTGTYTTPSNNACRTSGQTVGSGSPPPSSGSSSSGQSTSGCGSGNLYCPNAGGTGQCYSTGSYTCSSTPPYLCPNSAPVACNGGCQANAC